MPNFASKVDLAAGASPFSVAVSDLNGDGRADVVVANRAAASVSVLLNTTTPGAASPTFAAKQDFTTGTNPWSAAVGDLNGDGRPDVVVANEGANSVSVLLNTPETITRATAVGTITESDSPNTPAAQFSTAAESVNENTGAFSLTVALSTASALDTTIPFTLGGTAVSGTDYSGVTASPLVIAAGQTSGTITGALLADPGPGKMLTFTLGAPTNATLGAVTTNTLSIGEPEVAPTIQFAAATQSVNENGGTFSVTVMLSAASATDVTIPFTLIGTAVSGTDYSGVTTSPLIIPAGQTSGVITGTLIDDGKFNTVNNTLTFILGGPTKATLGTTNIDALTIVESDPKPTVQFVDATQSVNANTGAYTIPLILSAASSVDTTVPFTLTGLGYSVNANAVITAGRTTGVITGTLTADPGPSQVLTFSLNSPINAALGTRTTDTLTIVEPPANDPAPTLASIGPASATVGDPNVTITLTGTGFVASSTADFNGMPLATTFVSATQLTAVVPAADLIAANTDPITVVTAGPGGGASGPQTFTVNEALTANQRFLSNVYLDLLNRPIDAASLNTWGAMLDAGVSRTNVVLAIENDPGHEFLHVEVNDAFLQYLKRDADVSGTTSFTNFLAGGGTVEQMDALIVTSPEFLNVQGGGTYQGFLNALYQDALGRAIDSSGQQSFGNQTPAVTADAIFSSNEFHTDLVVDTTPICLTVALIREIRHLSTY